MLVRWGGEEFLIMSRSTDPSGTPAFCSRVLEVMAAEPFDLGHGISVNKTCSVGWAAYPWCRGAYEALCAEESIALADAALYRAKAFGRNQGVGIVPAEAATHTPQASRPSIRARWKPSASADDPNRVPGTRSPSEFNLAAPESVDKSEVVTYRATVWSRTEGPAGLDLCESP